MNQQDEIECENQAESATSPEMNQGEQENAPVAFLETSTQLQHKTATCIKKLLDQENLQKLDNDIRRAIIEKVRGNVNEIHIANEIKIVDVETASVKKQIANQSLKIQELQKRLELNQNENEAFEANIAERDSCTKYLRISALNLQRKINNIISSEMAIKAAIETFENEVEAIPEINSNLTLAPKAETIALVANLKKEVVPLEEQHQLFNKLLQTQLMKHKNDTEHIKINKKQIAEMKEKLGRADEVERILNQVKAKVAEVLPRINEGKERIKLVANELETKSQISANLAQKESELKAKLKVVRENIPMEASSLKEGLQLVTLKSHAIVEENKAAELQTKNLRNAAELLKSNEESLLKAKQDFLNTNIIQEFKMKKMRLEIELLTQRTEASEEFLQDLQKEQEMTEIRNAKRKLQLEKNQKELSAKIENAQSKLATRFANKDEFMRNIAIRRTDLDKGLAEIKEKIERADVREKDLKEHLKDRRVHLKKMEVTLEDTEKQYEEKVQKLRKLRLQKRPVSILKQVTPTTPKTTTAPTTPTTPISPITPKKSVTFEENDLSRYVSSQNKSCKKRASSDILSESSLEPTPGRKRGRPAGKRLYKPE